MRFLMMTKGEPLVAGIGPFIEELTRAGVLLATGALDPRATHIRSSGGKTTVTDFTEAEEAVAGFALIDVRSKEEAIQLSKRFWILAGDGEGVIQQVFDPKDAFALP
ncbi:MAG: YciI family protein [Actinomadura sp.]